MRILYFTQFYSPENIAAAFRASEHARIWAEAGHNITVFTGWPNYPIGHLFSGYEMVQLGEETVDGVRIFRSASAIRSNKTFADRIRGGMSFVINGWRNCVKKVLRSVQITMWFSLQAGQYLQDGLERDTPATITFL